MHQNAISAHGTYSTGLTTASDPKRSNLGEMLETLQEMHKVVSDLHSIADRAIGMNGEGSISPPSPPPNGMVGEVTETMHSLHGRLHSLYSRLCGIA